MTRRMYRSLQGLILALTALYLFSKLSSGGVLLYINLRFVPLTVLAIVCLVVLAEAVFSTRPRPGAEPSAPEAESSTHDLHEHDRPSWKRLAVLLIPILLGTLVPARPLGSAAVASKGVAFTAPASAGERPPLQVGLAPESRTVLDWLRAFGAASDPAQLDGAPADVIGFVYHDPRLPEGQFLVARFTLSCCAADAFALGVAVDWPQALEANSWVRVRGPIFASTVEGQLLPRIAAEQVEAVAMPEQPYLYP